VGLKFLFHLMLCLDDSLIVSSEQTVGGSGGSRAQ
jgi:hypothetical protein